MCYYRAGLWAETQGKEIHLVLLYRIGYWVRMSNLYATANKVNVNQRNNIVFTTDYYSILYKQ